MAGRKKLGASFVMNDPARAEISEFILQNSGCSISEIEKSIGINRGTLKHHLKILLRAKIVGKQKDKTKKGQPVCFFPKDKSRVLSEKQPEKPEIKPLQAPEKTNILEEREKILKLLRYLSQNSGISRRKLASLNEGAARFAEILEKEGFLDIKYTLTDKGKSLL